MSILFSQVVKKTTIYFAVIAFFALFLSQTTFAAPTLTFDSPTKATVDVISVTDRWTNFWRANSVFQDLTRYWVTDRHVYCCRVQKSDIIQPKRFKSHTRIVCRNMEDNCSLLNWMVQCW